MNSLRINGHSAKAIVRQNGLFGAELQSSKQNRKSTIEPHIYFRKQKALKYSINLKNYKTLLKSGIIFNYPCYKFEKAAIAAKKVKNGLVPAQTYDHLAKAIELNKIVKMSCFATVFQS